MEIFLEWLQEELKQRDWLPADLARRAELGPTTIHKILSGDRKAGPDVCVAIARALGQPPERVFRLAGLLPPSPEPDPGEAELLHVYHTLPGGQRELLLNMVRSLAGHPPAVLREERRASYFLARPVYANQEDEGQEIIAPDLEDIIDQLRHLDHLELLSVYDFIRWRRSEQEHRRASDGLRRKPDLNVDRLEAALERLSSDERELLLNWALNYRTAQLEEQRRAAAQENEPPP